MPRRPLTVLALVLTLTVAACGRADDGAAGGSSGGAVATGSAAESSGAAASGTEGGAAAECEQPGLVWRSGNKTTYESYPDPGSDECVLYNGCAYVGQFAACANTMPKAWVMEHDLAAVFPLGELALHRICVRAAGHVRVVTVVDTCADSDCDGCCSENRGSADALVDLESFTDARFGVEDGPIEWADLGPGDPDLDGCN